MLAKLRPRSAYDVMAALALFLVVAGGTAYATHLVVNGSDVVDESLTGADVRGNPGTSTTASVNGSLTTHEIAGQPANAANGSPFIQGGLTTWDIADGTLRSADVLDNSLGAADLAPNSVNTSEVADNSLTGADINESTLNDAGLHSGSCESSVNDVMARVGPLCVDRYEASVWSSPTGGTQYGITGDDYPCNDQGHNCRGEIYARSVAGARPSRFITWFQAQQALANSGKRLPTNAEWQMAAAGTPSSAACAIDEGGAAFVAATGSFTSCVSDWGINDMAGNVEEWVADWAPRSGACPGWGSFSNDKMCLAGAVNTFTGPGALVRGGNNLDGTGAGPFAIDGFRHPQSPTGLLGFRGAR